ncbi:MAG: hypothetical protein AAGI66_03415 [Cyanobacteria bacterium P01_H01_bin.74]
MPKEIKLFLTFILFLFSGLVFIAIFWNTSDIYQDAYLPIIKQSEAIKSNQGSGVNAVSGYAGKNSGTRLKSSEPKPYGLTESEIEKNRGKGFSTY